MISKDEVEKTILDLEQRDTSYAVCEKLAWLYIVRDHLTPVLPNTTMGRMGESEFLQAIDGADSARVWSVIDEHMNCVKALYPREYDAILRKIKDS